MAAQIDKNNIANWQYNATTGGFLPLEPQPVTTSLESIVDGYSINVYSLWAVNSTGGTEEVTVTDGMGNEFLGAVSISPNATQLIDGGTNGVYFKNGIKVQASVNDAIMVWLTANRQW